MYRSFCVTCYKKMQYIITTMTILSSLHFIYKQSEISHTLPSAQEQSTKFYEAEMRSWNYKVCSKTTWKCKIIHLILHCIFDSHFTTALYNFLVYLQCVNQNLQPDTEPLYCNNCPSQTNNRSTCYGCVEYYGYEEI